MSRRYLFSMLAGAFFCSLAATSFADDKVCALDAKAKATAACCKDAKTVAVVAESKCCADKAKTVLAAATTEKACCESKKTAAATAVLAVAATTTEKTAAAKGCGGTCCKDAATCASCCKDAAGCAKCCGSAEKVTVKTADAKCCADKAATVVAAASTTVKACDGACCKDAATCAKCCDTAARSRPPSTQGSISRRCAAWPCLGREVCNEFAARCPARVPEPPP